MKKMSRVDSKAEILQKKNSISMLKNAISKSVFMLLMIMMATGAMSFNTIETGADTNVYAAKSAKKTLPNENGLIRGKYRRIVYVALPGTKAVLTADREMFAPFVTGWNITINTASFQKRSAIADLEMNHNFILGSLHPIASNAEVADDDMIRTFIDANVVKPILQDAALIRAADESVMTAFINQYFTIWFAAPKGIDALISDSEMGDTFEEENKVRIRFSYSSMRQAADAETSAISKQ